MGDVDIRWRQRFQSFSNALAQLTEAVNIRQQRALTNLEKQGFVKTFEFTHELAWKVMRDYFIYQGDASIMGSRDATREAFQNNLISDGDVWMDMIKTRNKAVHTYDEATVNEVIEKTTSAYYPLFLVFEKKLRKL
ncbi:MAG: nucleotidyltransferase [Gammaproteobacteria bacterium]|nr:nucleotidyltransferase [Gammaproteobacteria bacterium]